MKQFIIEQAALADNISIVKKMAGGKKIIANVKCNGYGLGLIPYAKFLISNGIDTFGISSLEEGLLLRENGIENEIIMLTSTSVDGYAKALVEHDITATIGSKEAAYSLAKAGRDLGRLPKAHVEINTGMGRSGFELDELEQIVSLASLPIDFCGTFTHFSFSFSPHKKDVSKQLDPFLAAVNRLKEQGFPTGLLHCANSCAFLQYPETHLDAVRIGSAFLGRIPIPNIYGLKAIGRLESEIIEINHLKKGDNSGYGNTFTAKRDLQTAIIPVGYWDGFHTEKARDTFRLRDRIRYIVNDVFGKALFAEINGKKCRIIRRIGMYNIICDVTDTDAKTGDRVLLKCNPILLDSSVERKYV